AIDAVSSAGRLSANRSSPLPPNCDCSRNANGDSYGDSVTPWGPGDGDPSSPSACRSVPSEARTDRATGIRHRGTAAPGVTVGKNLSSSALVSSKETKPFLWPLRDHHRTRLLCFRIWHEGTRPLDLLTDPRRVVGRFGKRVECCR